MWDQCDTVLLGFFRVHVRCQKDTERTPLFCPTRVPDSAVSHFRCQLDRLLQLQCEWMKRLKTNPNRNKKSLKQNSPEVLKSGQSLHTAALEDQEQEAEATVCTDSLGRVRYSDTKTYRPPLKDGEQKLIKVPTNQSRQFIHNVF
ncbi:hypothetical protein Q7C36_014331 [Tachysurus vachellii]|uniref:Uncharacterized protein n=1 Tax=Tachysurus vachellii TaxID=175792 RepID=A0AA88MEZ7_TACVA|nr:hypothetical protein Q7C36_014331 [Tachysurus vachellii]